MTTEYYISQSCDTQYSEINITNYVMTKNYAAIEKIIIEFYTASHPKQNNTISLVKKTLVYDGHLNTIEGFYASYGETVGEFATDKWGDIAQMMNEIKTLA